MTPPKIVFATTPIGERSIDEMDSFIATTIASTTISTTIAASFDSFQSSTPSLEASIWPPSNTYHDIDHNLDLNESDTESTCSFYSAHSVPTSETTLDPFSPPPKSSTTFESSQESNSPKRSISLPQLASAAQSPDLEDGSLHSNSGTTDRSLQLSAIKQNDDSTKYSASSVLQQETPLKSPPKNTCLQCQIVGLRCSSAVNWSSSQLHKELSLTHCSRCIRSGEKFCIIQVIEERSELQYRTRISGVDEAKVRCRAEELLEQKAEKSRFALPFAAPEVRLGLKKTFRPWEEEDWKVENWDYGLESFVGNDD